MQRKEFLRRLAVLAGTGAAPAWLVGCGGGSEDSLDAKKAVDASTLSDEEREGLQFVREEEKLAHDVYLAMFERWGATVFSAIASSEAQHTEAVRQLLETYGVDDPAAGMPAGSFVNVDLQALYDQLVASGQVSLVAALKVGCLIEEKDIVDLAAAEAELEAEPSILRVYESLLCGSRNHLRAFNASLVAKGVSYVPQYISQAEWDRIALSPQEKCGR